MAYDNYPEKAMAAGQIEVARPRTVGENIDIKIEYLQNEVKRLQELRSKLAGGATLLEIDINDLREAMRF